VTAARKHLAAGFVAAQLSKHAITIKSRSILPYGEQFLIARGAERAVINVYSGKKGTKIVPQGASAALKKTIGEIFCGYVSSTAVPAVVISPKKPYIGSDESGKGDYFGPLAVAAFLSDAATDKSLSASGVRDSKKLTDEAALRIAAAIKSDFAARCAVVVLEPVEYNAAYAKELSRGGNLNTLLARLHADVIRRLAPTSAGRRPDVIVDAFAKSGAARDMISAVSAVPPQNIRMLERAERYPAVAAASVLARAAYLEGLSRLAKTRGVYLPKGAGREVSAARRKILETSGQTVLGLVAKTSFKIS
jgi:ribonuclease HIII